MKKSIKSIIICKTTVYLFTDNPEKDIVILQEAYEKQDDESFEFPLGYDKPELTEYTFLGNEYKCISLWFDNEDVPDFFTDF